MTLDEKIAAIEAGLEGVAHGPWYFVHGQVCHDEDGGAYTVLAQAPVPRSMAGSARARTLAANAAHIARLDPQTVGEIIAAYRALRAEGGISPERALGDEPQDAR